MCEDAGASSWAFNDEIAVRLGIYMCWKRVLLWAIGLVAVVNAVAVVFAFIFDFFYNGYDLIIALNYATLVYRIIITLIGFAAYLAFLRPIKTMHIANTIILFLVTEGLNLALNVWQTNLSKWETDMPNTVGHLFVAIVALTSSSFLLFRDGKRKKCPHCAEIIKSEANVCRYCGRDL